MIQLSRGRSRAIRGMLLGTALIVAGCTSGGATEAPASAEPAASAAPVVSTAPSLSGEPEFTLVAGATGPLGGPTDEIYSGFVDRVAAKTNGRVVVELHPNGELGGERELLEQVQQGLVDVSLASDSAYSVFDPKWSLMALPYVFATKDEAYAFLDGEGGKTLADSMLAKGIRILGYGENSMRQLSNNKRLATSIDDVKGLKIRVPESPPLKDWFESIGAVPTVIPFPELYPALQQGVVDGQDNGMLTAVLLKFQEVQKYWTDTNHVYSSIPIAINEAKWQQIPADLQAAILEAATESVAAERETLVGIQEEAIKTIESSGGEVELLSDEARAKFIESAKPIWQKYGDAIGADFMDATFGSLGREWR